MLLSVVFPDRISIAFRDFTKLSGKRSKCCSCAAINLLFRHSINSSHGIYSFSFFLKSIPCHLGNCYFILSIAGGRSIYLRVRLDCVALLSVIGCSFTGSISYTDSHIILRFFHNAISVTYSRN